MQLQPTRRSSLFLLELIISILFFSLAAAVCVRFFVKSHTIETESVNLSHAVTAASSVAEIIRSQENPSDQLELVFPLGKTDGDTYYIYYDEKWQPCAFADTCYSLCLTTEYNDSFLIGHIQISDQESSIYTLDVKKYILQEEMIS